ncbi:hypothetical protein BpHYR1_006127, partial [Brachionus plicatilis]
SFKNNICSDLVELIFSSLNRLDPKNLDHHITNHKLKKIFETSHFFNSLKKYGYNACNQTEERGHIYHLT